MRSTRSKRLCAVRNLIALNVTLLVVLGGPALGQEWTPEREQVVEQPAPSVDQAVFARFDLSKKADLTETEKQLIDSGDLSDSHMLERALQTEPVSEEPSSETASSDGPLTTIALYGFMPSIKGDVKTGGLDVDVDISFSDILDNLESGFMGFAEHRRGPWSFFADAVYLDISKSGKDTRVLGPLGIGKATIKAELEFQQTLAEVFVGYRVLDHDLKGGRISVDALAGARYNRLEVELSSEISVFGLTKEDADGDEEWVDGVFGTRVEYLTDGGWSLSGWADYGIGDGSDSYQLLAFLNYHFDNGLTLSGGYRYYYLDYKTGSLEVELDYPGPMFGLSYTF